MIFWTVYFWDIHILYTDEDKHGINFLGGLLTSGIPMLAIS